MSVKKLPRIVIAAPKSGSGKTLVTISLMEAFLARGKSLRGFKCGPDYIDPMFHKKVLGITSKNLDLFFSDEVQIRQIFADDNNAELSVIEGVMGLYDGIGGVTEEASTYHLARVLRAPIILVIDAKGMGLSLAAEIQGFLGMDTEHLIKGIILNNISKSFYSQIKSVIEEKCGVAVLGYFPFQKDIEIESRHLGLKLPDEISDIKEMCKKAGERIQNTVSLDEILKIAGDAADLDIQEQMNECCTCNKVRIGLAKDEAFCFYYEDNLKLLERFGAELVYFSPIHDKKLPEGISGLIFGGGYPEFYAKELSSNEGLLKEIREKIKQGLPSLAECGGFMFLHQNLKGHDKNLYKMAGVIEGDCFYTGKLVRFGYANVKGKNKDSAYWFGSSGIIKGHEFHYFDSTKNGEDCIAVKTSGKEYECGLSDKNHFWSFLHLYYPSNPLFAENFVEKCRQYDEINERLRSLL